MPYIGNLFISTEHSGNYEEENEDDEEDEVEFDVSKYVDKKVSLEENRKDDDYYSEHDEEDPLDEEEKLKRLQDVFSCLPVILIKRILRRDDVKGDLKTASKRLQEFQDMESPHDFFKSPAAKPPEPRTFQKEHLNCSEGQTPEAANGATKLGPQNGIPPRVKPKTRGKKASIQGRGRGLQMEQEARVEGGGQWEWSDVVAELKKETEFQDMESPHDVLKSPAAKPPEPRTFQKEHLNCSEGQTPEAANKATITGPTEPQNRIRPKVKPRRRINRARNQGRGRSLQMEQEAKVDGGGQWQWRDTEDELKRDRDAEYGGHRGRGRGGYRGERRGGPGVGTGAGTVQSVSQKEWHGSDEKIGGNQMDKNYQQVMLGSNWSGAQVGFKTQRGRGNRGGRDYQRKSRGQDNSERRRSFQGQFQSSPQHFGRFADNKVDTLEERSHESSRRMSGNWVQGQGGMKQAQTMPAVNQTFDEHRRDETLNEQDTALFERKKLLVGGLDEKTTDDGVLNFIEAMSREEVEDVVMLGKGRALVTMLQDITSK